MVPWRSNSRNSAASHHRDAVSASRARLARLAGRIGCHQEIAPLLRDRCDWLHASLSHALLEEVPRERGPIDNHAPGEANVHPHSEACRLGKLRHRRQCDVGDFERMHDLLDEPPLGLCHDPIPFSGSNDRRQVGAMRLLAHGVRDAQALRKLLHRRVLFVVDVVVVEHPIERVEVEQQRLIGVGVVRERDDARHVAHTCIRCLAAQGSRIRDLRQVANGDRAPLGAVVRQHLSRQRGRRAGVGEGAVLVRQPDPVPVARRDQLLAGGAVRAQA